MSTEIAATIRKAERNNIMSSFVEDMSKNVNMKVVIIIEADSGLSRTKKIRIGYAGSVNNQDFKFNPTNYKFKTEKINDKVIKPILEGFSKFDRVTSEDFKFTTPEEFVSNVFERVETGLDEEED
jgi:hypothetical protein